MKNSACIALLGLVLGSGISQAAFIDFNGLPGNNGDPFTSFSEAGFNVAASSGNFQVGKAFGNPTPSIFSGSQTSSVDVTEIGPGTFTFSQVDLGNAGGGVPSYTIQGFLNNALVLSTSGSLTAPFTFTTVSSPNSNQQLSLLRISFNRGTTSSYNIDNIGVNVAVPEPSSLALLGIAGTMALGYRLRRRQKVASIRS